MHSEPKAKVGDRHILATAFASLITLVGDYLKCDVWNFLLWAVQFFLFVCFVLFCSSETESSRSQGCLELITPPADSQVLGLQAHATTTPWFVLQFSPALCWEDCEVSATNSRTSCFWGLKRSAASMVGLLPAPPAPLQLPFQLVHSNVTTSLCQVDGHFVQAYHFRTLVLCTELLPKGPEKPQDNARPLFSPHPPLLDAFGHVWAFGLTLIWVTNSPLVHWSHSALTGPSHVFIQTLPIFPLHFLTSTFIFLFLLVQFSRLFSMSI